MTTNALLVLQGLVNVRGLLTLHHRDGADVGWARLGIADKAEFALMMYPSRGLGDGTVDAYQLDARGPLCVANAAVLRVVDSARIQGYLAAYTSPDDPAYVAPWDSEYVSGIFGSEGHWPTYAVEEESITDDTYNLIYSAQPGVHLNAKLALTVKFGGQAIFRSLVVSGPGDIAVEVEAKLFASNISIDGSMYAGHSSRVVASQHMRASALEVTGGAYAHAQHLIITEKLHLFSGALLNVTGTAMVPDLAMESLSAFAAPHGVQVTGNLQLYPHFFTKRHQDDSFVPAGSDEWCSKMLRWPRPFPGLYKCTDANSSAQSDMNLYANNKVRSADRVCPTNWDIGRPASPGAKADCFSTPWCEPYVCPSDSVSGCCAYIAPASGLTALPHHQPPPAWLVRTQTSTDMPSVW
jgi:hypothetical protein